jgi:DNA-directed RNA polymerase subunit RPC12/RpoP
MPDFKFHCSHCDQPLMCDEQLSGRQIQCPHCNILIRIPPVPGKDDDYDPETGMTWGTFVGGGNVEPPKNLSLGRRADPPQSPPAAP